MNDHPHHWICEPPVEGRSGATCKHCGAERVFTEPPELRWGDKPLWRVPLAHQETLVIGPDKWQI